MEITHILYPKLPRIDREERNAIGDDQTRHRCDLDDLLGEAEAENIFGLQHAAFGLAEIGSSRFDRSIGPATSCGKKLTNNR